MMAVPQIAAYGEKGKTSAVDYDSDFVWIEDGISPEDMKVLEEHGRPTGSSGRRDSTRTA